MKQLLFVQFAVLYTLFLQAQVSSSVIFTVTGNKNPQLTIDGINQDLRNSTFYNSATTVKFNSLSFGPHTYVILRNRSVYNEAERISSSFTLRQGFHMHIKVNVDGSLELIETRNAENNENIVPMKAADFNTLLQRVRIQRSVNTKKNVINSAFNTAGNYFTTNQVEELLRQITSESFRVQLAKSSYRLVTDKNNFHNIYKLLQNQYDRDELEAYVRSYNKEIHPSLTESEFNSLYQYIRQQWPAGDQVNSIRSTFNNTNYYFTTQQASKLIELIIGETNRLELAKLSYPTITDRNNFYQMNDLFSYQNSVEELTNYVSQYNNAGSAKKTAMSEANFNALYQSIQLQFYPGERMNAITHAFNNTNYYFTSLQAKQLIQMVTLDSNKLKLSKLSYRSVVDRNNFSQVIELLESQTSKLELEAYIKSYKE